jgi:hypothetical protein
VNIHIFRTGFKARLSDHQKQEEVRGQRKGGGNLTEQLYVVISRDNSRVTFPNAS